MLGASAPADHPLSSLAAASQASGLQRALCLAPTRRRVLLFLRHRRYDKEREQYCKRSHALEAVGAGLQPATHVRCQPRSHVITACKSGSFADFSPSAGSFAYFSPSGPRGPYLCLHCAQEHPSCSGALSLSDRLRCDPVALLLSQAPQEAVPPRATPHHARTPSEPRALSVHDHFQDEAQIVDKCPPRPPPEPDVTKLSTRKANSPLSDNAYWPTLRTAHTLTAGYVLSDRLLLSPCHRNHRTFRAHTRTACSAS